MFMAQSSKDQFEIIKNKSNETELVKQMGKITLENNEKEEEQEAEVESKKNNPYELCQAHLNLVKNKDDVDILAAMKAKVVLQGFELTLWTFQCNSTDSDLFYWKNWKYMVTKGLLLCENAPDEHYLSQLKHKEARDERIFRREGLFITYDYPVTNREVFIDPNNSYYNKQKKEEKNFLKNDATLPTTALAYCEYIRQQDPWSDQQLELHKIVHDATIEKYKFKIRDLKDICIEEFSKLYDSLELHREIIRIRHPKHDLNYRYEFKGNYGYKICSKEGKIVSKVDYVLKDNDDIVTVKLDNLYLLHFAAIYTPKIYGINKILQDEDTGYCRIKAPYAYVCLMSSWTEEDEQKNSKLITKCMFPVSDPKNQEQQHVLPIMPLRTIMYSNRFFRIDNFDTSFFLSYDNDGNYYMFKDSSIEYIYLNNKYYNISSIKENQGNMIIETDGEHWENPTNPPCDDEF
jgi:hypothetical protein